MSVCGSVRPLICVHTKRDKGERLHLQSHTRKRHKKGFLIVKQALSSDSPYVILMFFSVTLKQTILNSCVTNQHGHVFQLYQG